MQIRGIDQLEFRDLDFAWKRKTHAYGAITGIYFSASVTQNRVIGIPTGKSYEATCVGVRTGKGVGAATCGVLLGACWLAKRKPIKGNKKAILAPDFHCKAAGVA